MMETGMSLFNRILSTNAPTAVILIRFVVGAVFFSEGIQKFLYVESIGAGRFSKIGIPSPEFTAPFVGVFEITCGLFIVLGLLTRLAVLPTITIMIVSISTTKIPILFDGGFWPMGCILESVARCTARTVESVNVLA
jgi:putative oxidoreductase